MRWQSVLSSDVPQLSAHKKCKTNTNTNTVCPLLFHKVAARCQQFSQSCCSTIERTQNKYKYKYKYKYNYKYKYKYKYTLLLHDGRPGVHCVLNRSETAPGLKSLEDSPELELRGIVTQTEHIFIWAPIKYCPKYGAARLWTKTFWEGGYFAAVCFASASKRKFKEGPMYVPCEYDLPQLVSLKMIKSSFKNY